MIRCSFAWLLMWRSFYPVPKILRRLGEDRASSKVAAQCTKVGEGFSVTGTPEIDNGGELRLGDRVRLVARPAVTRLRSAPGGVLSVGSDTKIGFGCVLSASKSVVIGDRVELDPYVFAVDDNVGDPDFADDRSPACPIVIGDDVRVQSRATILKGARVGTGATIRAGSVVASAIPPGAVATGNPATVIDHRTPRRIHDPLFAQVWMQPDEPAIVSTATLTYAELWGRIYALAREIEGRQGMSAGARVLFLSSSKVSFVVSLFACSLAGAVAVPVPDSAARDTVTEIAEASGSSLFVSERASLERFGEPLREAGVELVDLDTVTPGVRAYPRSRPHKDDREDDPALIMFTSGTTAKKKAVVLTHANLLQATANMNAFMGLDGSAREFVSVPLHHSFGLGRVRAVLSVGGTLVLEDGPLDAPRMIQSVERNGVNTLSAVPAGFALFQGRFEALLRRIGQQIQLIELGSAFMTPEQKLNLTLLFPRARVCMHYGLTEASRSTFLEFRSESSKLHTVGRPSPNVLVRIVDAMGDPCAANVEGEIVVEGRHVSGEYLGDTELTERSRLADGGFRTGDYGSLDEDGYLRLIGRKDEMINKGGIKISPLELEVKLKELHPDVDLCVLGIPDPSGIAGEIPVVAFAGTKELDFGTLIEQLSEKVESTKLPDAVYRVAAIPRTENGKPRRGVLRQQLLEELRSRTGNAGGRS